MELTLEAVLSVIDAGAGMLGLVLMYRALMACLELVSKFSEDESEKPERNRVN